MNKRDALGTLALIAALALSGCGGGGGSDGPPLEGTIPGTGETPGGGGIAPAPVPAPGNGAAAACSDASNPRRLSQVQYANVVGEFVRTLSGSNNQGNDARNVILDVARFPADRLIDPEFERHQGFARVDQLVTVNQVAAIHQAATAIAANMTNSQQRVDTLLAPCTGGTTQCLNAFIRKAGQRLFRRSLDDAEVNVLRSIAENSTSAASVSKLLASMIASPSTMFVVETGENVAGACVPLTGNELAHRLSLHLWDSLPDNELLAAAGRSSQDRTSLLNPDGYAAQVTRMVVDSKFENGLRAFFSQWFRLGELNPLDGKVGNARFDQFAAPFVPSPESTRNAVNEVLDMVSFIAQEGGSVRSLLTDRRSFARTADIASLYKTPVWTPQNASNPNPPTFTEPQRVGLLGRVAFIANGASEQTLPIQRGLRVLQLLGCETPGQPAGNQSPPAGADLSGHITTRTRTERVTEQPRSECEGCHKNSINPWGFVMEGFDALGRARTNERVFDSLDDATGQVLPVNTRATVRFQGLPPREVSTLAEAQQYVLESGRFESCFARKLLSYTFGRAAEASDLRLIESVAARARQGAGLKELLAEMALRDEFKKIQGAGQ